MQLKHPACPPAFAEEVPEPSGGISRGGPSAADAGQASGVEGGLTLALLLHLAYAVYGILRAAQLPSRLPANFRSPASLPARMPPAASAWLG